MYFPASSQALGGAPPTPADRRTFYRVRELGGGIAVLADADEVAAPHIAEALQYRS